MPLTARRGGFTMNTEIIDFGRDISGGYKMDVSRGENVDCVSSEWFSRPDDERYLPLDDLLASVKAGRSGAGCAHGGKRCDPGRSAS